jgi:DNA-binding response OmpR family regulator
MAPLASVLVVADVGDAERAALEAACTEAGFTPVLEASAEAAPGKLTAKRCEALVVHLGTPGAALACMRARGKLLRHRIPVIALVDDEDDAAFARAYRAGADEVILATRLDWLVARLRALPKPSVPQPGSSRGDAVVADADRIRAEVLERVLRDAGFRVEVAADAFSTRLQAGRPTLKVAVVDASLEDAPSLIAQARTRGSRCAWVVRARPELLDELRQKLAHAERVAVVSAYGPPEDVLFETNRLLEPRPSDGRSDARLLHGTVLRLRWGKDGHEDIGYSYNVSSLGIFVRTLVAPAADTVEIEARPPGGEVPVLLECKVAWRREFGTTRREPVPAGFGVQIIGGDIDVWAEACPRAPSLRHPMPPQEQSERAHPPAKPGAARRKAPLDAGAPAPGDAEIRPREPQHSVEEMLAAVLSETIPDEDAGGGVPLNMDGDGVVELVQAAHDAEEAPFAETKATASPAPVAAAPSITPASLGFDTMDDAFSASSESMEVKSTDFLPAELGERAPESPTLVVTDADTSPGGDTVWPAELPASSPPVPSQLGPARALAEAGDAREMLEMRAGAPGLAAVKDQDLEASQRAAGESPEGEPDGDHQAPKRGASRVVWGVLGVVAVGVGALIVVPALRHPAAESAATPVVVAPTGSPAPAPSPRALPSAEVAARATEGSAGANGQPAPHAASAAPPAGAAPSGSSAPDPSRGASSGEGDEAAVAALPKGHGFLFVASKLATNVYVYGILAGTTNQRIDTKCGPRFVRLGSAPGAWQGEGFVEIVKCGAVTRVDVNP